MPFQESRWLTTLIMLAFVALTLVAAFVWQSAGLCFLFVFCQFLAWVWYCLSYIPFARCAHPHAMTGITLRTDALCSRVSRAFSAAAADHDVFDSISSQFNEEEMQSSHG